MVSDLFSIGSGGAGGSDFRVTAPGTMLGLIWIIPLTFALVTFALVTFALDGSISGCKVTSPKRILGWSSMV